MFPKPGDLNGDLFGLLSKTLSGQLTRQIKFPAVFLYHFISTPQTVRMSTMRDFSTLSQAKLG